MSGWYEIRASRQITIETQRDRGDEEKHRRIRGT